LEPEEPEEEVEYEMLVGKEPEKEENDPVTGKKKKRVSTPVNTRVAVVKIKQWQLECVEGSKLYKFLTDDPENRMARFFLEG
jgi:hypothetical protein